MACVLCSSTEGTEQRSGLALCAACYAAAFEADMALARVYRFEPADHVAENVYLGPEGATLDAAWLEAPRRCSGCTSPPQWKWIEFSA